VTGRTRVIVLAAVAVFSALATTVAYAYFSSSGTATNVATTATMQPVTVAALTGGDAPSSSLRPGGTGDVVLRIQNTNPFTVTLVSVAGGPAAITADAAHPGCTTTGVTFANQTGLSASIAASPGTTLVHLPNAAAMSAASSNGCQGATFSIPVTITVQR
jgi:hypothetical protein